MSAAPVTRHEADLTVRLDGAVMQLPEATAHLDDLCARVEDLDDEARVVVLELTGVPAPTRAVDTSVAVVNRWERALRRVEKLPAYVVGVVGGACGGLAMEALLVADHRILTPDGILVPPGGTDSTWPGMLLHRLGGQATATAVRRVAMLGTPIDTAEALALHLAHEVTDDVPAAVAAAAGPVAGCSGSELAIRRRLLLEAPAVSYEEALGAHLAACDRTLRRAQGVS